MSGLDGEVGRLARGLAFRRGEHGVDGRLRLLVALSGRLVAVDFAYRARLPDMTRAALTMPELTHAEFWQTLAGLGRFARRHPAVGGIRTEDR